MYTRYSDEWFLDLYFQYGSVDEMIKAHNYSLPISQAQLHRVIKKRGIIKAAGRHASMAEVLHFFAEKAIDPHIPLERLYYEKMPRNFRVSVQTLHRIYRNIERKAVRRSGVALVITSKNNPDIILTGKEKNGQTSLLMGYAKKVEDKEDSILRILQQEFSTKLAIKGKLARHDELAKKLISNNNNPFMYLDITDVRVKVFNIILPEELCNLDYCSSHKITNHKFINIDKLENNNNLREGVTEIISGYKNYINNNYISEPEISISKVNEKILAFTNS